MHTQPELNIVDVQVQINGDTGIVYCYTANGDAYQQIVNIPTIAKWTATHNVVIIEFDHDKETDYTPFVEVSQEVLLSED